ncbi:MAG: prolyl oligopeptidase family serine peptidase, partial [Acidobacteriota bacterium]
VAECGIYNVRTFAETMPSWWQPIKIRWLRRIGDVLNDETFNRKISPHFHGEDIKARLLIIHGENDPRVNIRVANEFVDVVRKGGGQVQYVVYPGEGHGIGNFPNLMDMLGREEEFLAKHLGGRFEPWKEMKDSTVHVK